MAASTESTSQARVLLEGFASNDRPEIPANDIPAVKAALTEVVVSSDFQTLGICADSSSEGFSALSHYLLAFGLEVPNTPESEIEGPIYIKYNTQTGKHYTSDYPGNARGVLVCCHRESPELSLDMYGHLPLDLFASQA